MQSWWQRHQPGSTHTQEVGRRPCPWLGGHFRRQGAGAADCWVNIRAGTQGLPGIKGSPTRPVAIRLGGGPTHWPLNMRQVTTNKPSGPQSCLPSLHRPCPLEWLPAPHFQGQASGPLPLFPPAARLRTHTTDSSVRKGRGFILKRLRIYKRGHFVLKRDRAILAA